MATNPLPINKDRAVSLENAKLYGDELIDTPIGDIELVNNYFDDDASQRLYAELDYQRAAQCYIWSTPLVSMTTWRNRQGKAYGSVGANDFAVLKSLKEKRGIVTANLTTPYIFNFSNLKDGPLVVEYPAGKTAGGILDFWQRPLADLGLTGPDKGNGGKYIVIGPEHDPEPYQEKDAFVFQSTTNNIGVLLRILDTDPAYYEKFKTSIKMGRHGKALLNCRFVEGKDVERRGAVSSIGRLCRKFLMTSLSEKSTSHGLRCSYRWESRKASRLRPALVRSRFC